MVAPAPAPPSSHRAGYTATTSSTATPQNELELDPLPDDAPVWVREREILLLQKLQRERDKQDKYKKSMLDYEEKEREFVTQMESQMDMWEATEKNMTHKLQTLEAENEKLKSWGDGLKEENKEKGLAVLQLESQNADTEKRVQFLMDRLVSLLSTQKSDDVEKDLLEAMAQKEKDLTGQIEKLKSDLERVRQQNREFAVRLVRASVSAATPVRLHRRGRIGKSAAGTTAITERRV
eukprot:g4880.t1